MSHISRRTLVVTSAFMLSTLALGMALYPAASTSADSTGTEVVTNIQEFIKLAVDTNALALKDSNNNTTIVPSSSGTLITGDVNVAVTTNTAKGYTLSIYTADNTTAMTHENSNIDTTIDSISTITGYDAATGLSSLSANTWGFRRNTGTAGSPTYGNWFGVGADSTHAVVIDETNEPNDSYCDSLAYPLNESGCANGSYDEYALNFGANPTSALPAGIYTNDVVISAVAKSEGQKYSVTFDSNGGSNTMGTRTIIAGSTFTMPSSSNVTKPGYGVAGYAFTSNAASAAYTPGQIVTVNDFLAAATSAGQTPENGMTLYIIWQEPIAYFQDINSCSTIPEGETGTLTDSRDNQEYTVYHTPSNATYPDTSTVANVAGKCIMTKDLNLGAVASVEGSASTIVANGAMTLSPEDSNFTTPTGSGESITVPTISVTITNGTGNWTTTNSYSNKKYITSGTGDYANRGYYSWGAAMIVCPKGWRLPTQDEYNNNDSSYNASTTGISKLVNNNLSTIQSSPWSFVLGGEYSGSFSSAGSNGFYWSSTQYSSTYSYYLRLHSSNGLIRNFGNKYFGFSVRCIAEAVDGTMQNFDTSSLALGETANLIDERDNHIYKVKKLSDGKVWMINNLTLTATDLVTEGKALTSANTNIPSSDTNSYYVPPKNTRYATANSITNSNVATASTAVNFDTSYSNQPQAAFRTQGDTSHSTGNALPEDTAWYPFYTATLGFSYYSDGKTSGSSPRDICPKGWRLPKVSDNGTSITAASSEFANLARSYNSSASWANANTSTSYYTSDSTIRQNMIKGDASSLDPELDTNGAAGFTYAGLYNSTTLDYVGTNGYYWSSSVYNSNYGYLPSFNTSYVYPQNYGNKNYGLAVRCVAD